MAAEDPGNTAPESQVSAPDVQSTAPDDTGNEVRNEREFEQSFTQAADAQPTPKPAVKPAQPAAPAQPPAQPAAQAQPAKVAAPPVTPEQWQQAQAEIERYRQMAAVGQRYAAHAPDIDRFLSERQQAAQQEQAAQAKAEEFSRENWFKEQWKVPELTDQMQQAIDKGLVELDERGIYVAAKGFEAMVAPLLQGINDHTQQHQQTVRGLFKGNFFENAYGAIEKPLMHQVEQLLEQRFEQFQQHARARQTLEQFTAEYSPVLYAADAAGNQTLTPEGQRFVETVRELEELNPEASQEQILSLAKKFSGLVKANQHAGQAAVVGASPQGSTVAPAPTPPTPAEVSAAKKQSFLEAATSNPGHGRQTSPHVLADGPMVADQGELDTFFSQQFANAGHS